MTWHIDDESIVAYQELAVDQTFAASIEAHLQACSECQRRVASEPGWLEQSWAGIVEMVEDPAPTGFESVLRWLSVPPHLARVIAVTPSLRPAWLLATALMLAFAGLASAAGPSGTQFDLFLAVAPVVPVLGVAFAYGRIGDPAHEIMASSPMDQLRLVLLRSSAVTAVALVIATAVDVANGVFDGVGVWLVPTLALTATALALGTRMRLWLACASVVGLWVLLLSVVASRNQGSIDPAFDPIPQLVFAVLTVVALVSMTGGRADRYRRGEK
jgi:hypothetical protein